MLYNPYYHVTQASDIFFSKGFYKTSSRNPFKTTYLALHTSQRNIKNIICMPKLSEFMWFCYWTEKHRPTWNLAVHQCFLDIH